ncbi:MAG: hypothetical protein JSS23_02970 [Proteobacteria bacterium]|nr:hypothetical protein [Pseudomonadota bacterium]
MTDIYKKQGNGFTPTALAEQDAWGFQGLMVTAAFRYCCGRSTYIVGACVDWLIAHWEEFPCNTRDIIRRDLEREFARDDEDRADGHEHKALGHDCDRREWERVRALWKKETT